MQAPVLEQGVARQWRDVEIDLRCRIRGLANGGRRERKVIKDLQVGKGLGDRAEST